MKKNIDKNFENKLTNPISSVDDDKTDDKGYHETHVKDMFVLHNMHNRMLLRDISLPKREKKKPPMPDIILDNTIKDDIIKRAHNISLDIKQHFRETVVPFMLGFESADTDLQNDLKVILDEEVMSLLNYRAMTKDLMKAHLTKFFSKHFDIEEEEIKKIIDKSIFGREAIKDGKRSG